MRALVAGTGAIGQRHIRNMVQLWPGIEITLLRRPDAPALAVSATARSVDNIDDAMDGKPDFAIIATPSAHHIDILPPLIAAGIPCYVEKPVVTDLAGVRAVEEALANGPRVPHVVGFNLRILPSMRTAGVIAREGRLGTIVRASFAAGQWLPDWRPGQDHRTGYSASPALGGGVIFDLSHELDAARALLGEYDIVAAAAQQLPSLEIASHAAACILGRTGSGCLITIALDYVARRPVRRYELIGDQATLIWDLPERRLLLCGPDGTTSLADDQAAFNVGQTYLDGLQDFVDSISTGRPTLLPHLADGLKSTTLSILTDEMVDRT